MGREKGKGLSGFSSAGLKMLESVKSTGLTYLFWGSGVWVRRLEQAVSLGFFVFLFCLFLKTDIEHEGSFKVCFAELMF